MKEVPKISDTEWEIMRVVWKRNPITAHEIIHDLIATDASWHPKTVRTLLSRLVQKGALAYSEMGRVYVYRPLVSEQECVAAESESFLARVFGGSLTPLVAHFVESKKLSKKELEKLQEVLEQGAERKRKKG